MTWTPDARNTYILRFFGLLKDLGKIALEQQNLELANIHDELKETMGLMIEDSIAYSKHQLQIMTGKNDDKGN